MAATYFRDKLRADPLAPPEPPACKPDNTELAISDDTSCDIAPRNFTGLSGPRCGKPGVIRFFFGCPHEHIGYADVCAAHQGLDKINWTCHKCGAVAEVVKTEKLGS